MECMYTVYVQGIQGCVSDDQLKVVVRCLAQYSHGVTIFPTIVHNSGKTSHMVT